ncbi:MAG: hypothetical protein GX046_04340 [Tissierellia bacterium]|nr:hypothetical protein [Tissierellia bacterium]
MKSMKVFEITLIFTLMAIFLGLNYWLIPLCMMYLINLRRVLVKEGDKLNQRLLLEKLSEFSTLLQQGYSPIYAYEMMDSFAYPSYMIDPLDELFRWEIFEKQFQLFEKKVLLEEEIQGEMMVVRLRMSIMKLMPLALLLFIRHFLPGSNQKTLNVIAIVFFLINHWLSEVFMERL